MSVLRDKYRVLAPRAEYLSDIVILAQAWKKAHAYVRRHNWYSDTLELDCSAVGLDVLLDSWSSTLKSGKYRTVPVRLVPAPKNGVWDFHAAKAGGWGPRTDDKKPALRPLAHIGIRDQTIATAVMLALADCIESAQGETYKDPHRAAAARVASYGNRLYCQWRHTSKRSLASFSWGNSDTYSRYFQDYQRFVERPGAIAQQLSSTASPTNVYIVKLDLSGFYDNIDHERLLSCLETEYKAYRRGRPGLPEDDKGFWELASRALRFEWSADDHELSVLLRDNALPRGLPQGLVASGFFANAYLLDFDRAVQGDLDNLQRVSGVNVVVHDYCRYVDDLRLVVSSNSAIQLDVLGKAVSQWVQSRLDRAIVVGEHSKAKLAINADKTEVEVFSAVGRESGVAARMKALQQQLSGPFDMAALHQLEAGLDGLLALAELDLDESGGDEAEKSGLQLASVARPKLEVRDDTLTRFSAYRLTKSLRLRRSMTDLGKDDAVKAGFEHEFEVTGRRLVAAWARNPSLVQVLRYGLDIYPSPDLLGPILDALRRQIDSGELRQQHVALYVIAELLKAGATETGWRDAKDAAFKPGNIAEYRSLLARFAVEMTARPDTPWYVLQQAAVFLASQRTKAELSTKATELGRHRLLADFIDGASGDRTYLPSDVISVSLIGHQLLADEAHYKRWFTSFARGRVKLEVAEALEILGQNQPDLFRLLTRSSDRNGKARQNLAPEYLRPSVTPNAQESRVGLAEGELLSLAAVLGAQNNPFVQENALLQLAKGLAKICSTSKVDPERLTPASIRVRCRDWKRLLDPNPIEPPLLDVEHVVEGANRDPRYLTPEWCDPKLAWMYAIGRILRSAATGEVDFTARQWVLREDPGRYTGIRSTWQKRRFGMFHAASSLGGTMSPITPWFSDLLLKLLQWPGIRAEASLVPGFDAISSAKAFIRFIDERLTTQAKLYGVSSRLPVYVYPVEWPLSDGRPLRVAMVQGLMPQVGDFKKYGVLLDKPGYRQRHRKHTAALINLAYRQLLAHQLASDNTELPKLAVDLIIFPEYSIHPADQDLIRGLSDATGAMVFYGLVGVQDPLDGQPVNVGRWLVPQRRGGKRSWIEVDQGKWNLTETEKKLKPKVKSWRPYQVVIELRDKGSEPYRIAGSICYDATDISLAADLRDVSHMYIVAAMNRDVKTFDSMVGALRYHMYQHVIVANTGEFGGSTAQAPYDQEHHRLIAHVHGSHQVAVSLFEVDVDHFGPKLLAVPNGKVKKNANVRIGKTPPAGLNRT